MKRYRRHSRPLIILSTCLLIAVLITSVGFSGLSSTITWEDTTSNKTYNGTWGVSILNSKADESYTSGYLLSKGPYTIATEVSVTENSVSIGAVTMKVPGDYVSIKIRVKNNGNVDAKLKGFTLPTPAYTQSSGTFSTEKPATLTIKYSQVVTAGSSDGVGTGTTITAGNSVTNEDLLLHGEEVEIEIKFALSGDLTESRSDDSVATIPSFKLEWVPAAQWTA